jgi:hypothetical protein
LLNGFKYGDLTFEAERPAQHASICVDPRKPIVFIETFFNEKLDATGSRDLCKSKLGFGRFERVSDGPAEPECAIECTRKRHAHFVANSPACANGIVNYFSDGAGLRLGEAGVKQNQAHMRVVQSEYVCETLLVHGLASTMCSTKNEFVSLTSVSAKVNDLWFVQQQQLL